MEQLRALLDAAPKPVSAEPLSVIQASVGNRIRRVPIEAVVVFDAADKYLRVLTRSGEYPIRTPLKELALRLEPRVFWQVHRGTLVRANAIDSVLRDESGRLALSLRGCGESFALSRLCAHLFKAMQRSLRSPPALSRYCGFIWVKFSGSQW